MKQKKERITHNAETAFQRSKIYRLLSFCFFYPDEELGDFFKTGEFRREIEKSLGNVLQRHTEQTQIKSSLSDVCQKTENTTLDAMIDEHVRLLTFKSASPPYENEYHRAKGAVYSTEEMADIAGFYRAMGMDFVMERPDHIATELEFMHVVTLREADAISRGDTDNANACVSLERKFLCDHLGSWVDVFSDLLTAQGSSFYGPLSELLRQWIHLECTYLQVAPRRITDVTLGQDTEEDEQICLGRSV